MNNKIRKHLQKQLQMPIQELKMHMLETQTPIALLERHLQLYKKNINKRYLENF
jgi:hypothetical protein